MDFKVGVLDLLLPDSPGVSLQTIHQSIDLAPIVEELGFSRYWIAEHQASGAATSAPRILASVIAGVTDTIRVGVGGVLLNLHRPLEIAEDFRLIAGLFPGRIDLGLARGIPAEPRYRTLLRGDYTAGNEEFRQSVGEVVSLVAPEADAWRPNPWLVESPEVWVLGTSASNAAFAARNGLNFGLSLFHAYDGQPPRPNVLSDFRSNWTAGTGRTGRTILAIAGSVNESAERLAELQAHHNQAIAVPNLLCAPEDLRARFQELREAYCNDEFMFVEIAKTAADRQHSLTLISEALHLR